MAGVLLHEAAEVVGGTAFGERAGGVEVRHEHLLVRAEDGVGLAHEVYAAHHDDVRVGPGCLLCQAEAVAHIVGDVLYGPFGIVVSEDDGIFLLAELFDFSVEVDAFREGFVSEALLFPRIFDVAHGFGVFCLQK